MIANCLSKFESHLSEDENNPSTICQTFIFPLKYCRRFTQSEKKKKFPLGKK